MKKNVIFIIVISLFFSIFPFKSIAGGNNQNLAHSSFILNGLIVSHIPASDLLSKNSNAEIGLEKVDNAYDLKRQEYFCNSNTIPLFAKVNLLSQKFTAKKALTVFDLKKMYDNLPQNDYYERERIIGTISSGIYKNNVPLSFSKKTPPVINIKYKKVSAGKKTSYIPIRVISEANTVDTYFLLDPFAKPLNERLNGFDIARAYDVEPCFSSTIAERKSSNNNMLDFTGFYVDVPSNLVDSSYYKTAEETLKKFQSFIHKKGKLLIVENLDESTYKLGQYGDIIGVSCNDPTLLEKTRSAFPNKLIFATINTNFDKKNLEQILKTLSLFGIYPDFGRNKKSGDFVYYENEFKDNIGMINKYLNIIRIENGFTFQSISKKNGFEVAQFTSNNGNFTVIQGNGYFPFKLENAAFQNTFDIYGKPLKFSLDNSAKIYVNGINAVFSGTSPIYMLGMVPQVSKANTVFDIKNFSAKDKIINIFVTSGGESVFQDNSSFLPLSLHTFYTSFIKNPVTVKVGNLSESFNKLSSKTSSGSFFIFVTLLMLLTLILLKFKKIRIKKLLNVKMFIISILILPSLFIFVNTYFIHYSLHTMTYLTFALMFIILALYEPELYFQSLSVALAMAFMGFLFNYLEFSTLSPHFFNGILPFTRYDSILLLVPFLGTILFFGVYGGAKVNKLEIAAIIIGFLGPVFFFDHTVSPFILNFTLKSVYSIFIVIAMGGLLGALHKKGSGAYLFLYGALLLLLFGAFKSSNTFYIETVMNQQSSQYLLLLKDFVLFSLPVYFLLLFHHNIVKESPSSSINILVFTLFTIVVAFTFASQWAERFKGITLITEIIALPAYIIAIFLLFIILFEPMNKNKEL